MPGKRLTILFTGHVQGVGFRWSALRAMEGLPVTGFVRNLRDGRVELVLEGEETVTRAAAARVRVAMRSLVVAEEEVVGPPTGEFSDMRIRP